MAHAAPEKLSIDLEVEQVGGRSHARKELHVDPSSDWKSLDTGTQTVLLTRVPESVNGSRSVELLVLDRNQPGKILASPTIQLRDSAQTRARLKLENGDWISVKIRQ